MSNHSLPAVLRLLGAQAQIEQRFSGKLGSIHGLSLKETLLLMHLSRAPRQRLTRVDLAKMVSVSASTITRMAAPLEKLGLVSREPDPRDARLAYVVLTEAGGSVVADAAATFEQLSADVFQDRWTEPEIERLASLLGRLTAGQPGHFG